ncbi:MAG TPA: ATP-binding protein [Planctomycetota bacterium]|nr:ATP-binding protein [Planctomycetota bacterium]
MQQVLVNLVKNAIEASEGGDSTRVVEVEARVVGDQWVCEIRDRGHGLQDGAAEQAFEPSFSTKPGGTGLGLAICRRNIDAMGGSMELRPREGGGVVARVTLELASA